MYHNWEWVYIYVNQKTDETTILRPTTRRRRAREPNSEHRQTTMKQNPLAPYWRCLYKDVVVQDGTSISLQWLYFLTYLVAHLPVLFPTTAGIHLFGFHESFFTFDQDYLPQDGSMLSNFIRLISITTGLSYLSIFGCASIAIASYAALIWTDVTTALRPFPWPKSWETDNNACYDDMFCEPPRRDRVIRRLGNTLSNFFYLFLALVVLLSTVMHGVSSDDVTIISGFIVSDFIFGVMLLILAVSSTIWHGCNAMWSHAGKSNCLNVTIVCDI